MKSEGHHFDIRKHLLDYDDVMNEQRKAVYKQRRRVIAADVDATRELMLDSIERVVVRIVDRCCRKNPPLMSGTSPASKSFAKKSWR